MKKSAKASAIIIILLFLYLSGTGVIKESTKESTYSPVLFVWDTISTMAIDTTRDGLIVYYPKFSRIDLVCETMPSPEKDTTGIFCCAASFTSDTLKAFSHLKIAGDHVSSGERYKGYRCERNTGAFVFYDNNWKFLYDEYSSELDSAKTHGGMGFGQEMIIHQGKIVRHARPDNSINLFRALCDIDGQLCIADAKEEGTFGSFINYLMGGGVSEALYLDMGIGWNCSWARTSLPGEGFYIHLQAHTYTTNWITFYYE